MITDIEQSELSTPSVGEPPKTNIFRSAYEQPENKLTYCFLALIEHTAIDTVVMLLQRAGRPDLKADSLTVELLYGGGLGNPDGSITLRDAGKSTTLLFENKTWRRNLDLDQVERHLQSWTKSEGETLVLVITYKSSDRELIKRAGDSRILFMTWQDVLHFASCETPKSATDVFLLRQFAEYLESSEEAWRARMLSTDLLSKHSAFLAAVEGDQHFVRESQRLMQAIRDDKAIREDVFGQFSNEIKVAALDKHWGRIGIECQLAIPPWKKWVFFGIYHDTSDHGIPFKMPREAEFAIFLDMDSEHRKRLASAGGIKMAIADLTQSGYEFNFPETKFSNTCRVCFWRESMWNHVNSEPAQLARLFAERLCILFNSSFYEAVRRS